MNDGGHIDSCGEHGRREKAALQGPSLDGTPPTGANDESARTGQAFDRPAGTAGGLYHARCPECRTVDDVPSVGSICDRCARPLEGDDLDDDIQPPPRAPRPTRCGARQWYALTAWGKHNLRALRDLELGLRTAKPKADDFRPAVTCNRKSTAPRDSTAPPAARPAASEQGAAK